MEYEQSRDWDAIDWDALDEGEFAELITRRLREAPPALTQQQLDDIEKDAQAAGVTRRAVLASLTQPGAKLIDAVVDDHDTARAFADLHARIREYLDQMTLLTDLVQSARMRLMVALAQRDDMQELLDEVDAGKE